MSNEDVKKRDGADEPLLSGSGGGNQSLDDLDAVLNFADKEFDDIVQTMAQVLSAQTKKAHKAQPATN